MKPEPTMAKWPFLAGDIVLIGLAIWIVLGSAAPLSGWAVFGATIAVAAGAWLAVTPYGAEHRAALKLLEADRLTHTVAEIEKMHGVAEAIGLATSQWQTVQEESGKTVSAAREIFERMNAEAKAFQDFLQKANDTERNHLRLEVEKLRRAEGDWLQALVRLLDHVYALFQAAERSGQASVRKQLANFQTACREIVRRLGLIAVEPRLNEPFDEQRHQVAEGQTPQDGSTVQEVLATGYSFQGQLLRRALVSVNGLSDPKSKTAAEESEADLLGWRHEPPSEENDEAAAGGGS